MKIKMEDEARGVAPVRNRSSMCSFDSSREQPLSERYRSRRGQDWQLLHLAPEPGSAGSLISTVTFLTRSQCCGSKYIEFGSGSRILAEIWIWIRDYVIDFEKKEQFSFL